MTDDQTTSKQVPVIKSGLGTNLGFRTPDFVKQANARKFSQFGGKKPITAAKYGPSSVRTQHKGGK